MRVWAHRLRRQGAGLGRTVEAARRPLHVDAARPGHPNRLLAALLSDVNAELYRLALRQVEKEWSDRY